MIHFNLKPPKIFYGWWIVVACLLITLYTAGTIVYGFTAFFEPIANEYEWSYAQVSLAASLRGVELGILAPIIGLLVDRWGPRRLLLIGSIIIGFGLFMVSRTTSLSMFYGGFALVAIGISGCSPTVVFTAVANWFKKKVGVATGIMTSGFSLGALLIPVVVWLIDIFDWQNAIFIIGLGTMVIGALLSPLVRHKPQQYGYQPDGEKTNTSTPFESLPPELTNEVEIGAKQALKSRAFWHIALAGLCQYLGVSAMIAHIMPYLSSVGITRSISSLVATALPLTNIFGRISCGWLGDRFDKRWIAVGIYSLMSLGLLISSYISTEAMWLIVPFIILFSTSWGGGPIIRAALQREYFGTSRFGTIHGLWMGICAFGSFTGPLFAGWVFDNWGSYYAAWLVFATVAFAGLIIMGTIPTTSTKP